MRPSRAAHSGCCLEDPGPLGGLPGFHSGRTLPGLQDGLRSGPRAERQDQRRVARSLSRRHHLGHAPRSVTAGAAGRSRKALIVRKRLDP